MESQENVNALHKKLSGTPLKNGMSNTKQRDMDDRPEEFWKWVGELQKRPPVRTIAMILADFKKGWKVVSTKGVVTFVRRDRSFSTEETL